MKRHHREERSDATIQGRRGDLRSPAILPKGLDPGAARNAASGSTKSDHPLVAIGVGCRAGVAGEAVAALARRALSEAGAPEGERRMFTLAAKANEPGLIEAARLLRAKLTPLPLEALQAQAQRIATPSAAARARFGAPNIAEAAALAGAGVGGRLLAPRLKADGATCAIALWWEQR
jgi:cobalt-precorrin 5A hydrolase